MGSLGPFEHDQIWTGLKFCPNFHRIFVSNLNLRHQTFSLKRSECLNESNIMSDRYGISIGRILHPTDFSHGSEVAFTHALRLCCATNGSLAILHVDKERRDPDWDKYPSVRETLARW